MNGFTSDVAAIARTAGRRFVCVLEEPEHAAASSATATEPAATRLAMAGREWGIA
jgi:hypothetical protein